MGTGVSVSVDVAMILTALAPTLAILTTAWLQAKARARDSGKIDAVHTLVNDQMTREKAARLDDLRTQRIVLGRLLGEDPTEADSGMLDQMDHRIRQLSREITKRDETARSITTSKKGD